MSSTPSALTARRWPFPTQAEARAAAAAAADTSTATNSVDTDAPGLDAACEPAVTPWFPWTAEPVQIGVYQRRNSVGIVAYSLWDGARWLWNQRSPAMAVRETMPSAMQQMPWRGLAQPPAEGYGPAADAQEATPC